MKIFYSPEYVRSAHAFETTRKAKWVADSLRTSPIIGLDLVEPRPLTAAEVELVHDPKYVRAIQTGEPRYLAESQGFVWDPGLWPTVLSSNGGTVAAALDALERGMAGSLSSGMHHARRATGAGFCTFNGLVLAARAARVAGVDLVLILDLDAHCGGGTASLIADDLRVWQTDVAVNMFDFYGSFGGPDEARRVNFRVTANGSDHLSDIEKALGETADALASSEGAGSGRGRSGRPHRGRLQFDLCIYNAGMDPHEYCSTGGLRGITRETLARREELAFAWCREHARATAFVLAGGYVSQGLDEKALVDLHRLTLQAAVSAAV